MRAWGDKSILMGVCGAMILCAASVAGAPGDTAPADANTTPSGEVQTQDAVSPAANKAVTTTQPAVTPVGVDAVGAAQAGRPGQGASEETRPLGPPTRRHSKGSAQAARKDSVWRLAPWRVAGSLVIVIALIVCLKVAIRWAAGSTGGLMGQLGAAGRAPSGVISVLARYPIARGQTLVLLQLDVRVLLLCQTPNGFQTLCEIEDAEQVASVLMKVRDQDGASEAGRFRSMLSKLERDPKLVGDEAQRFEVPPSTPRTARWRQRADAALSSFGQDEAPDEEALDPAASLSRRLASLRRSEA